MQSYLLGYTVNNPSQSAANYASFLGHVGEWDATETKRQTVVAAAGNLTRFIVNIETPAGGGKSWVFVLYKNGTPTALAATIQGAGQKQQADNTHTVAVVAGDRLSVEATPSGTPANAGHISYGCVFTGTTSTQMTLSGGSLAPSNAAITYQALLGGVTQGASIDDFHKFKVTAPGSIAALYVWCDVAVAVGTWTVSVALNGTEDASTRVAVTASAQSGNVTGLAIAVVEGDDLSIELNPAAGTPTNQNLLSWALLYLPTTVGEGMTGGQTNAPGNANTTYLGFGGDIASSTSEVARAMVLPSPAVFKRMRVTISGSAGAGGSYVWTFRKGGAGGNQTVTITAQATYTDATHTDSATTGDLIATEVNPAGAPTTRAFGYGYTYVVGTAGGGPGGGGGGGRGGGRGGGGGGGNGGGGGGGSIGGVSDKWAYGWRRLRSLGIG